MRLSDLSIKNPVFAWMIMGGLIVFGLISFTQIGKSQLPDVDFPCIHRSRMVAGEPFFRMQEIEGPPNSETRIHVIMRGEGLWHYALTPVTGRKHQLRVHMAALGAPIANDAMYPSLLHHAPGDYSAPLQLLAKRLSFIDPFSGVAREFCSKFWLQA